ncbi:MAG TPA: hypothetical protein VFF16_19445 [Telluria sp.]|nr:hypothetical protein [Telluria sp.]
MAALLSMQTLAALPVGAAKENTKSVNETWIERPWEIRYIIDVLDRIDRKAMREISLRERAQKGGVERFQLYDSLVAPESNITLGPESLHHVVALEFDRKGRLLTKHDASTVLYARRSVTDTIKLTGEEVPYFVAEWFQGLHGAGTEFAPAVCGSSDRDRYHEDWDRDYDDYGNFGCREWTYQLNESTAKYIDVTSYSKHGASIGRFTGWARFTDPPRPVIGKHRKRWYCLYECPAGEHPGPIANIKTWTRRHGFPMPRGPHEQPEFPDKNYPDDRED